MKYKKFHKALNKYCEYKKLRGVTDHVIVEDANRIKNLFRMIDKDPFKVFGEDATLLYARVYKIPKYMTQNKELDGLIGGDIIDKSLELGLEYISTATVEKYWSSVNGFFNWAVSLGYISNNCFSNLKPKKNETKDSEQRKAFNEEQIGRLLNERGRKFDDLKWIITIAIELGMRQNEIAQLHRDDIVEKDGVLCIYVTNRKSYQHVKNKNSIRYIPVTNVLIKLGFMDFVNSKSGMLFESLTYCKKNKFSRKVSEEYSKLSRTLFDDKQLTFHSVRHYFTDKLKKQNVPEDIVAEIKGQKYEKETYGRYGKERDLKLKRRLLNKYSSKSLKKLAMEKEILKYKSYFIGFLFYFIK